MPRHSPNHRSSAGGEGGAAWQLHHAARRWLMERHAYWTRRYAELPRRHRPTPEHLDTFPRYHAAAAMLEGVERLRPDALGTLHEAREQIAAAAQAAETPFTRAPGHDIEARAIMAERAAFAAYVSAVSEADLARAEPLPWRRVLDDAEIRAAAAMLRERWGVEEGYWYPLAKTSRGDVLALQAPYFERGVGGRGLAAILLSRGMRRLIELREHGPSYELDAASVDPAYDGAEGFWFVADGDVDWVVYASHESSITLGGQWLIDAVKRRWPQWERFVWTTPFF